MGHNKMTLKAAAEIKTEKEASIDQHISCRNVFNRKINQSFWRIFQVREKAFKRGKPGKYRNQKGDVDFPAYLIGEHNFPKKKASDYVKAFQFLEKREVELCERQWADFSKVQALIGIKSDESLMTLIDEMEDCSREEFLERANEIKGAEKAARPKRKVAKKMKPKKKEKEQVSSSSPSGPPKDPKGGFFGLFPGLFS